MTTKERSRIAASISAVAAIWLSAPGARPGERGGVRRRHVADDKRHDAEREEPEGQAEEKADVGRADGAEAGGQTLLRGVAEGLARSPREREDHPEPGGGSAASCLAGAMVGGGGGAVKDLGRLSIGRDCAVGREHRARCERAKVPRSGKKEGPRGEVTGGPSPGRKCHSRWHSERHLHPGMYQSRENARLEKAAKIRTSCLDRPAREKGPLGRRRRPKSREETPLVRAPPR